MTIARMCRGSAAAFYMARPMLLTAMVLGAVASGCVQHTALYEWGRYEDSLYASYVKHDEAHALSGFEATITSAQNAGRRIPPGACAEYGFSLYRRGQREGAIQYFQQEARLFPESQPLMERLIAKVREQSGGASTQASTEDALR